ncbi:polymorphic toxin-type HINT domain-containing protein [Paenibacillus thiaminolyticus]|uniref:polymorphic toxin-type HINT domain-containing protein n=1 Tax=Paenibacillus thiaminolyticus TaxID=49283 RepID=UPI0037C7A96A
MRTEAGFKPIEQIRVGDLVQTKDETTGKTGYNTVIELFQRQTNETYKITVKGITITTTEEHPFWVPGRGWIEARHLKVGDLLQNPEGKLYPINRIEIKNGITTVYNFRVEGVHNYFVTELEIWTHNCGAGGMRNIPMRAPSGGGGGSSKASKGTGTVVKSSVQQIKPPAEFGSKSLFEKANNTLNGTTGEAYNRTKHYGNTPSKKARNETLKRDNYTCQYCGSKDHPQADHNPSLKSHYQNGGKNTTKEERVKWQMTLRT